jgi:dTDP-4-dehydrorhamnose reductase
MVWITGSNGMLGQELLLFFKKQSIPCLSSDMDVNITDLNAVEEFVKGKNIKWIINCSAYTAVDLAEDEKEKAFSINGYGVKNLAVIAEKTGAKLIHFSTDYVFNGTKQDGYTEDDAVNPVNVYGASKLEGERKIAANCRRYFIFRISWLYGAYGKNFVHTMLTLLSAKDEINVVNDQYGSPTYTGELADFIKLLVDSDSDKYGVYNFSGEGKTTWYDFTCAVYTSGKKNGLIEKDTVINPVDSSLFPTKAKRPAYSYLLKDKLYNTFKYRPAEWKVTLEGYIKSFNK